MNLRDRQTPQTDKAVFRSTLPQEQEVVTSAVARLFERQRDHAIEALRLYATGERSCIPAQQALIDIEKESKHE